MTDCRLEIVFDKACSNLLQNRTLNQVMYAQMQARGRCAWTPASIAWPETSRPRWTATPVDQVSPPLASVLRGKVPAVFEGLAPYDPAVEDTLFGSTDVADATAMVGSGPHRYQQTTGGLVVLGLIFFHRLRPDDPGRHRLHADHGGLFLRLFLGKMKHVANKPLE
ncbi:BMP/retinoic acid-inducible neural-specific protein 2 [Manis javanica]|nr:BMP/retinoic acid-inducible neural-specific protein 2 [Manis javanica]